MFPLQYLTVKFYLHRLKHADQDDTFNTPSSSQNSHRLQKTRSSRQSRAQSVYIRAPQEGSQEAQPVYIRTPQEGSEGHSPSIKSTPGSWSKDTTHLHNSTQRDLGEELSLLSLFCPFCLNSICTQILQTD